MRNPEYSNSFLLQGWGVGQVNVLGGEVAGILPCSPVSSRHEGGQALTAPFPSGASCDHKRSRKGAEVTCKKIPFLALAA